jgi:hypothetical protein
MAQIHDVFSARSPGMLVFSRKVQNPTGSMSITYPSIRTTDAHSHSAWMISFTRIVPEASAIGQRLAHLTQKSGDAISSPPPQAASKPLW